MSLSVTILGAGTGIPAKGKSPAGIYVRVAGEHVLLDAGAGTLQRLYPLGVTFVDLDRIFLSHYHPDHCLDLVSILFAMRIPSYGRTKPLIIYGPRGLRRLYRELNQAFQGWLAPQSYRLTLKELGVERFRCGRYTVQTARMNHYDTGALGYRLTAGNKSLVYSGDTDYCRSIVKLGKDADLLILECSTPDALKMDGHLSPESCGRIAAEAGCRKLLLTHRYPVFKKSRIHPTIRKRYRGPLIVAEDYTYLKV